MGLTLGNWMPSGTFSLWEILEVCSGRSMNATDVPLPLSERWRRGVPKTQKSRHLEDHSDLTGQDFFRGAVDQPFSGETEEN